MALYSDSQPLDCLNLSVNYVSHWTYLQGLRELYSNFMDACIEVHPDYGILLRTDPSAKEVVFTQGKRTGLNLELIPENRITYNRLTKELVFENDKSFPIKCLLMGCSEKGPQALGQFGEGMKVSMIVLLKSNMTMTLESGHYSYFPTVKSWDHNPVFKDQYNYNVLYVKVQNKPHKQSTRIVVENVDDAKFEQFLYLSLALLDQSKYKKIRCGPSVLIFPFDTKLIGKIFKKGVRLQLHQSANSQKMLHYSYDLDSIKVGRERDCVNNVWDLYKLQSELHYNIICKFLDNNFMNENPDFRPLLKQHLKIIYGYLVQNNYQTHFFHSYSPSNKPVCDKIYQKFLQHYQKQPNNLYPQYQSNRTTNIKQLLLYRLPSTFYPVVDVSWQLWHTVSSSNYYKPIEKVIQEQIGLVIQLVL